MRHYFMQALFIKIRVQKTFSIQGQMLNILASVGHFVSVTTTQLHCCNAKVAIDNM